MLIEDKFAYVLANREFYEPLERYHPDPADYQAGIERLLPFGWQMVRGGVWVQCQPVGATLPRQGWKIHLSATLANSEALLSTAARLLFNQKVPFKFLADRKLLLQSTSKRWSRGGAGKFVTIYPSDVEECRVLLELLRREMEGYDGPYILSDRRFRESRVVHYRYGAITSMDVLDIQGHRIPVLHTSGGSVIPDQRLPYFSPPDDMVDPFATDEEPDTGVEGTLKNGRYVVQSVIAFSNTGGVYLATDEETGRQVLIKEARPFTGQGPTGDDAVSLLKREHRLLRMLASAGIAPRPIDFFQDWEHHYLVEEFLEGTELRGVNVRHSLALRTRPTIDEARAFTSHFCRLYTRIASALLLLERRGIVFGDVSHDNVMVLDEGEEVRLIDFEGAYQEGVEAPPRLTTPGFAPPPQAIGEKKQKEDDRFGFGGLMLAAIMPINTLMELDRGAPKRFLDAAVRDLGFPESIASSIQALLDPVPENRPGFEEVMETLSAEHHVRPPEIGTGEADVGDLDDLLGEILSYIESVASPERSDRLYPADPEVFATNPLSVAYGACGIAYTLHRINGLLSPSTVEWISSKRLTPDAYPPGLYVGLSGIAWTLLDLGLHKEAEDAMHMAHAHPLRWNSPDLFHGVAGSGMAQIRFFLVTGEMRYLEEAERSGQFILRMVQREGGEWWATREEESSSLGHGTAGVCLFLLYLALATGNEEYVAFGRRGLDSIITRSIRSLDGGLTWKAREGEPTVTPYWRWGSAGIGMTMLRYRKALNESTWDSALEGLIIDVDRKYTLFPGRSFGLAGIGEFFLDLADFEWSGGIGMHGARKALSGIRLFQLKRSSGIAFPGESLSRISCDFNTGSAGIAYFLHRLLKGGPPAFMLDELLKSGGPRPDLKTPQGPTPASWRR
jgi:serine/threonine protein kinase